MTQKRSKNLATITFVASSETEVRTIAHLKKIKDKSGVEIKAQILRAVTSLTDLYSIGDDPNCTKQDLEDAMVDFMIDLTSHLNRGLSYAKHHKHQIDVPPKSWTQFCQIADSIFPGDLSKSPAIVPIIDDLSKSPAPSPSIPKSPTIAPIDERSLIGAIEDDDEPVCVTYGDDNLTYDF